MKRQKQKTFSILEIREEEKYISQMASEGNVLVDVKNGNHIFSKNNSPFKATCVIEFFVDELPKSNIYYENQGLVLVKSFKGQKGYWNYFLGLFNENLTRREDDYKKVLKMISRRNEIFWTIIPLTIIVFAFYMLMQTKSLYFIILIIASIIILFKIRGLGREIKNKLEEWYLDYH